MLVVTNETMLCYCCIGGLGATISPFLLPVGLIFFVGWNIYLHRRKSSGDGASSSGPTPENIQDHRAAGDKVASTCNLPGRTKYRFPSDLLLGSFSNCLIDAVEPADGYREVHSLAFLGLR